MTAPARASQDAAGMLQLAHWDEEEPLPIQDEFFTPNEAHPKLELVHRELAAMWEPPPRMTVSEWADTYRYMPAGTSPLPGQWKTQPYQIEMQDVFDDPNVHEIVVVKCTQIGWSDILNNIIGKHIHLDPKPIMMVQPSLDDAKGFGKKRITPMINSCPPLRDRVKRATSRQSGNTLLLKEFFGGFLKLTGANSGKGLRSDPVPIVLCDESDAYPDDVDGEGNPIDIAKNRTEGYDDYKFLNGSTPAKNKGLSRLEKEFEASDQRHYHVPCPHCGLMQVLQWRDNARDVFRLVWEKNAHGEVIESSVRYICEGCNAGIAETYKQQMLERGDWVAKFPGRAVVGFHINALYRPWKDNWGAMAQSWVKAQGDNEKLKEFIMLQLAEFWEEAGERASPKTLSDRKEEYPHPAGVKIDKDRPWDSELVPRRAAVLTCQGDVQHNRIEGTIKAWGHGEESWLIRQDVFWGDPNTNPTVWEQFDQFRLGQVTHESGAKMRPVLTVVDSGDGSSVDAVYDYVMPRQNLRDCVYAMKGVPYHAKPVLVQEGTTKRAHIRLFTVSTHTAKDLIFSRLKLAADGPGRMHFPKWTTDEYFNQLVSEKRVKIRNKRTGMRKITWVKTHTRNEALDLEVYALGALFILQNVLDPAQFRDLERLARALAGEVPMPKPPGRRVYSRGAAA